MRLLITLLLFLSLSPITAQDTPALEPLTPDNIQWLVPLLSTRTGDVEEIAWMPGEESLAVELLSGVWVFPTQMVNNQSVVDKTNGVFYPSLSQITLNSTRTRLIALEVLRDARLDQPAFSNVWDLATGEIIVQLAGITGISLLSPDGQSVLVVDDARVEIYSLESGQRTDVFMAPQNITGVDVSHDGHYLAMTGHYSSIDLSVSNPFFIVYDLTQRTIVASVGENVDSYFAPRFTPDDRMILLTNNYTVIQYWMFDPVEGTLSNMTEEYKALGFKDDREGVVTFPDNSIFPLNPRVHTETGISVFQTWEQISSQFEFSNPRSIRYDPSGNLVYYSSVHGIDASVEASGSLRLVPRPYEMQFFEEVISPDKLKILGYAINKLWMVNLHHPTDYTFSFEQENQRILLPTLSRDFELVMYIGLETQPWRDWTEIRRMETGELVANLSDVRYRIFSRDARRIAGLSSRGVLVWDIETQSEIASFELPASGVGIETVIDFSPDGTKLTAISDGRLLIWDIVSQELEVNREIQIHYGFGSQSILRYSEDGKWLAIFDGDTLYLWQVDDFNPEPLVLSFQDGLLQTRHDAQQEMMQLLPQRTGQNTFMRLSHVETEELFAEFFLLPWEWWQYGLERSYSYHPTGSLYVTNTPGTIYDAVTDEILTNIGNYLQIEFDPAGTTVATTNGITATIWGVPSIPENPAEVLCEGAPPPRLQVGGLGIIAGTTRVRGYPNGTIIGSVETYTSVEVVRGPICERGILWWGIETSDRTLRGWVAEAISPKDYLVIPQ